jgi:trans-aconitate methyltransferase
VAGEEPAAAAVWAVGRAYEPYIGRWSRFVARELVAWLEVAGGAAWLDVGCGTGALGQTVLEAADPATVLGVDPSEGFVAYARAQLGDARARLVVPTPAASRSATTGSTPW